MFSFCRKYVMPMLLLMPVLFAIALTIDEYNDHRRATEGLRVEVCAEIEAVDLEWDGNGTDNGDGQLMQSVALPPENVSAGTVSQSAGQNAALMSDAMRRGLVHHYAPLRNTHNIHYILI